MRVAIRSKQQEILVGSRAGLGQAVDVPPDTLARWEAAVREFNAVQVDMARVLEASGAKVAPAFYDRAQ